MEAEEAISSSGPGVTESCEPTSGYKKSELSPLEPLSYLSLWHSKWFLLFKKGTHCVALAVLELIMYTKLFSNSEICLSLPLTLCWALPCLAKIPFLAPNSQWLLCFPGDVDQEWSTYLAHRKFWMWSPAPGKQSNHYLVLQLDSMAEQGARPRFYSRTREKQASKGHT